MSNNLQSLPRVFISYARSDGEQLATQLRQQLEAKHILLWQDRIGMEGGKDWWQQITGVLDDVEFMVLVMTPASMQSEMVRKEWHYARQVGVCVYPVKAAPDLDFSSVPHWMSSLHFYDLDHEWQKLIDDLNKRCQELRVPFMCKNLPPDFVPRTNEFDALIKKLLDEQREEPIAITTALRGAGGFGKTTMAQAFCHDLRIRDAFDDGILWVTLSENPGHLVGKLEDLIYILSEKRPGFTSIDAASAHFAELLEDRDILLVIDDVWNSTHLEPFLQGGNRCARLVTTRNENVLRADVQRIQVDAMQHQEAVQLLGSGLSSTHLHATETTALEALATRLGEWALLLKLVNGVLRERISRGQSIPDAFTYVNTALDKRGLTAFDDKNAQDRSHAIARTLSVSLDLLSSDEKVRYQELAIFPEDVDIPLVTLQKLWGANGGLDDFDTEELCERLNRFSLLLDFDLTTRSVRLHDVVRTYLRQEMGETKLAVLHGQLLAAYGLQRWADLPEDDLYMWDHLADHLIAADHIEELTTTVKDLRYVTRKALLRGVYACQTDLIVAAQAAHNDAVLSLLTRNINNMSHLLKQCETFNEIASVLCSRLRHLESLSGLCHALEQNLPRPYFSPWHTLPDLPHPALICILQGHTAAVYGCAVSPDSSFIVSASDDHTLKIWDAVTGREHLTLRGHNHSVNGCAVSPDGSYIVSASDDHTLKIWDAVTGQNRLTLRGHTDGVSGCVVSPRGDRIVSTSYDKTQRVWDAQTGQEYPALEVQSDSQCAMSPNGDFIVSISRNGLKVWDTQTGVERFTLQAPSSFSLLDLAKLEAPTLVERFILGLFRGHLHVSIRAVSPDGSYIVSASYNGPIQIWDTLTGLERFTLIGHTDTVKECAISPDGNSIISVSDDRTLRVWDAHTGQQYGMLRGHTHWINGCAVSPKGDYIVSASQDRTLNVWDISKIEEHFSLKGHKDWVRHCALSPHGDYVVTASNDETLKLWGTQSGQERMTLQGHAGKVNSCAVSPDGDYIVSASDDKTLIVWDAYTGSKRFTLRGHKSSVSSCAVSPQGDYIVSASFDKTLMVWDAQTGTGFTLYGHKGFLTDCAVSPKGDYIVSSSEDGTLTICNIGQEAILTLPIHKAWVTSCKVSPDGDFIVSTSWDKTIKVWNPYTGAERLSLLHGPEKWLYNCAMNPAGTLIISVSEDGALKLWDAQSGKHLTTLFVDGALLDCAFHPDGEHVIAAGKRGLYFLRLVQ